MRPDRALAGAAGATALVAAMGFGAALPGYSHLWHPLALPGASGVPRAGLYNLMLFGVPALLLAALAWRLRARLPDGRPGPRLGAAMLLLAALGWGAQGAWPLDLADLDAPAGRLHASAWTAWWISFVAGATLLATGLRTLRPATVAVWLLVPGLAVLAPWLVGAGISQRLAFGAWFGWMWLAAGPLAAAAPRR